MATRRGTCPSTAHLPAGASAGSRQSSCTQLTTRNTRPGHLAQRTVIALQVLAADEHRGQLAFNLHHVDGVAGYRQSKTGCGCVSKANKRSTSGRLAGDRCRVGCAALDAIYPSDGPLQDRRPRQAARGSADWLLSPLPATEVPPWRPPGRPPGVHAVDPPGVHPPCAHLPYTKFAAPTTQRPQGDRAQTRWV